MAKAEWRAAMFRDRVLSRNVEREILGARTAINAWFPEDVEWEAVARDLAWKLVALRHELYAGECDQLMRIMIHQECDAEMERVRESYREAEFERRAVRREVVAMHARYPGVSLRARVLARDGHKCVQCGQETNLQVDHVVPYSLGGKTCLDNLQTLCASCNSRKGARVESQRLAAEGAVPV